MIIANIWIGIPFNLVVLYSGLQGIPPQLYEAAALDGASGWQRFWRITFPLLRPVSAITLLLGLVYTLKVFDIIWIMTKGGPADSSTTFATWSYRLGFGNLLPDVRTRRRRRQPAHRDRARLRAGLHPVPAPAGRAGVRRPATWWKTGVGLVLTALMLFPVYWMINVSFTRDQRHAQDARRTGSRSHGTLDGYRAVLDQQLPYLGTSLLVGLGTVALTLVIAAPAGYALAKLRPRGGGALSFLLLVAQMIPGIIMAMGFYAIYLTLGVLNTVGRPDRRRLHDRRPVRGADLHGVHVRHPRRAHPGGRSRRRRPGAHVLVGRPAGQPQRHRHRRRCSRSCGPGRTSSSPPRSTAAAGCRPITLGIYHYIGNNNQQWNAIMATAVVASIPAAVLLVVAQRYVAAGVTAGAVKD